MQGKRYAGVMAAVLSVLALGLSGCGAQKAVTDVTNLQVDKSGMVTHTIVETFDKDFYTVEGLTTMIQEELASYQADAGNGEITLVSAAASETDAKKVVATMTYSSGDVYSDYNGEVFFYGTVAAAKAAGYKLDVTFMDSADAGKKTEGANGMESHHILITGESMQITLPNKVLYLSEGVTLTEGRTVVTSLPQKENGTNQTNSLAYVITK